MTHNLRKSQSHVYWNNRLALVIDENWNISQYLNKESGHGSKVTKAINANL